MEYNVYLRLAKLVGDDENTEVLKDVTRDEKSHYEFLKEYTGKEFDPNRFKLWFYLTLARVFGITFGLRLMELGEEEASVLTITSARRYHQKSSELRERKTNTRKSS